MTPFPTPEACALAGFPATAKVAAAHVVGDYAAVYVVTDEADERGDWLSVLRRSKSGWEELAGGDGGHLWTLPPDCENDNDGVLAIAYPVERRGRYLVRCADRSVVIDVEGLVLAALLFGVGPDSHPALDLVRT